ncbi:protocatechuate 3,4-dioxygenase subunit alpha [Nocardioides sp. MAHUQ-72]|uniref:protocatechuate 3,4-dioxygenase subunit alpha n=1 Tax=unclassified Nocardioides TaxID=2615069 RepID=UPI0036172E9A
MSTASTGRVPGDLAPTPGQTVGPFYGYALPYDGDSTLAPPSLPEAVRLHGRVLDGAGQPVPDALLELWQADPSGRIVREPGSLHRDGFTFTGWGRCGTDNTGRYSFSTLRPGPTAPGRAAYFAVTVFARGLLNRLQTRAYLPGDTPEGEAALAADPLLTSLDPARRGTLVAGTDEHGFVFDIRLQGEDETVFLTHPRH